MYYDIKRYKDKPTTSLKGYKGRVRKIPTGKVGKKILDKDI